MSVVDLKEYRDKKIKEDIERCIYEMEIDGETYLVELELDPFIFEDED